MGRNKGPECVYGPIEMKKWRNSSPKRRNLIYAQYEYVWKFWIFDVIMITTKHPCLMNHYMLWVHIKFDMVGNTIVLSIPLTSPPCGRSSSMLTGSICSPGSMAGRVAVGLTADPPAGWKSPVCMKTREDWLNFGILLQYIVISWYICNACLTIGHSVALAVLWGKTWPASISLNNCIQTEILSDLSPCVGWNRGAQTTNPLTETQVCTLHAGTTKAGGHSPSTFLTILFSRWGPSYEAQNIFKYVSAFKLFITWGKIVVPKSSNFLLVHIPPSDTTPFLA